MTNVSKVCDHCQPTKKNREPHTIPQRFTIFQFKRPAKTAWRPSGSASRVVGELGPLVARGPLLRLVSSVGRTGSLCRLHEDRDR